MHEPLTLRQIVTLLQGCLDAGADPEKPVGVHVGRRVAFVDSVSVTTDPDYDDCDVWIGATDA